MVTHSVSIDSLSKVRSLVNVLKNYQGHFELISGTSVVNAKSVMGIFSLDISQPVLLNIYDETCAPAVIKDLDKTLN